MQPWEPAELDECVSLHPALGRAGVFVACNTLSGEQFTMDLGPGEWDAGFDEGGVAFAFRVDREAEPVDIAFKAKLFVRSKAQGGGLEFGVQLPDSRAKVALADAQVERRVEDPRW